MFRAGLNTNLTLGPNPNVLHLYSLTWVDAHHPRADAYGAAVPSRSGATAAVIRLACGLAGAERRSRGGEVASSGFAHLHLEHLECGVRSAAESPGSLC
jgi:hypothetical protein